MPFILSTDSPLLYSAFLVGLLCILMFSDGFSCIQSLLPDLFLTIEVSPLSLSLFVCPQVFFLALKSQCRASLCLPCQQRSPPLVFPFCLYLVLLTPFFDRLHFPVHTWSHPYQIDHLSTLLHLLYIY